MTLKNKKILIIIGGGIAAYKSLDLIRSLKKNGVEANVHYPTPIHLQPASQYLNYNKKSFPETVNLSKKILTLPLYPGLSLKQQDYVVDLFSKFYK